MPARRAVAPDPERERGDFPISHPSEQPVRTARPGGLKSFSRAGITSLISELFPSLLTDERDKFESVDHSCLEMVVVSFDRVNILHVKIPDRNDKFSPVVQLIEERLRDIRCTRGHEDTVERGKLLPADRSVTALRCNLIPQAVEAFTRLHKQLH